MKSKICRVCKEEKDVSQLVPRADRVNGVRNICKVCHNKSTKKYYHDNAASRKDYNKSWREANETHVKAKSKAYHQNNKDVINAYTAEWRKANNALVRSYGAARRSRKLYATPIWLTQSQRQEIDNIYALAKDCEVVSGQSYHVDHIIPLKGKNVCGLHVPWNLQVLPSDINQTKSNNHNGW